MSVRNLKTNPTTQPLFCFAQNRNRLSLTPFSKHIAPSAHPAVLCAEIMGLGLTEPQRKASYFVGFFFSYVRCIVLGDIPEGNESASPTAGTLVEVSGHLPSGTGLAGNSTSSTESSPLSLPVWLWIESPRLQDLALFPPPYLTIFNVPQILLFWGGSSFISSGVFCSDWCDHKIATALYAFCMYGGSSLNDIETALPHGFSLCNIPRSCYSHWGQLLSAPVHPGWWSMRIPRHFKAICESTGLGVKMQEDSMALKTWSDLLFLKEEYQLHSRMLTLKDTFYHKKTHLTNKSVVSPVTMCVGNCETERSFGRNISRPPTCRWTINLARLVRHVGPSADLSVNFWSSNLPSSA